MSASAPPRAAARQQRGGFRPEARRSALLLGAVQCLLLVAIGGQMLVDRALRPRGWALVEPVDPDLPIRGRYIRLNLVAPAPALSAAVSAPVRLVVRGGRVQAIAAAGNPPQASEPLTAWMRSEAGRTMVTLDRPLAFFLPPDVPDPSARAFAGAGGERLWVEVTLPARGLPRPIRLGTGPAGPGAITPLALR